MRNSIIYLILATAFAGLLFLNIYKINWNNLGWTVNAAVYQQIITCIAMLAFVVMNYRKSKNV